MVSYFGGDQDCLPEELITEMCFEGQIEICNIGGKE